MSINTSTIADLKTAYVSLDKSSNAYQKEDDNLILFSNTVENTTLLRIFLNLENNINELMKGGNYQVDASTADALIKLNQEIQQRITEKMGNINVDAVTPKDFSKLSKRKLMKKLHECGNEVVSSLHNGFQVEKPKLMELCEIIIQLGQKEGFNTHGLFGFMQYNLGSCAQTLVLTKPAGSCCNLITSWCMALLRFAHNLSII